VAGKEQIWGGGSCPQAPMATCLLFSISIRMTGDYESIWQSETCPVTWPLQYFGFKALRAAAVRQLSTLK